MTNSSGKLKPTLGLVGITINAMALIAPGAFLMKVDGNGQGKILTLEELRLLFTSGFVSPRDLPLAAPLASRSIWHLLIHWLSSERSAGTPDHRYQG